MVQFTNQATLSYDGISTVSNIVTGELVEVLSATKTAINTSYGPNDNITYVLSLVNSGNTAFSGLSVSDNLGAYTLNGQTITPLDYVDGTIRYYQNGVLQAAPTVTAGPPMTISAISVPANGNATLIYDASVNSAASPETGGSIENLATISGGGLSAPVTADATISAADSGRLSISKAVSPSTVAENGEITYTFIIQNSGNAAVNTAVVSDTFDPILNPINVTFNGTPWSAGTNYTYDSGTGQFSTVAGQITVPAATYTQDPTTGIWSMTPGVSTLVVRGTV